MSKTLLEFFAASETPELIESPFPILMQKKEVGDYNITLTIEEYTKGDCVFVVSGGVGGYAKVSRDIERAVEDWRDEIHMAERSEK